MNDWKGNEEEKFREQRGDICVDHRNLMILLINKIFDNKLIVII